MDKLNELIASGHPQSRPVAAVVEKIAAQVRPEIVYLYNQKFSPDGASASFKLCVVGEFADKAAVERDLYREIDSEIPFDIILYTREEWSALSRDADSFAWKIARGGTIVYE